MSGLRGGLTLLSSITAVTCCILLVRFFLTRWSDPVFRAFTVYFALSGSINLLVALLEVGVQIPLVSGVYASWRPVVIRLVHASALVYLVLAIGVRMADGRGNRR